MSTPTAQLSAEGVSIWLDDLSRERITTGNLAELIATRNVTGVTTNPSIFQAAIGGGGHAYAAQIAELASTGASVDDAIFAATTDDVRDAADIFRPVFDATNGLDGRVSIEVSPDLAHDTEATIAQAKELWKTVDRDNVLIKIPATKAGLPAITEVIGSGISVNVTLIFSLERYAEVIDAYLAGLEQAKAAGLDLSKIHSVASFFVSRVDTEVDKRLKAIGTDEAAGLTSLAGVANARLAYELYEQEFATDRAKALTDAGANAQRPLWASTGVKDPVAPRHAVRDRARRSRHRQHDAREDASGDVRPRRDRGRHRHGHLRGRAQGLRRPRRRRRRLRRRHPGARGRGRREVHRLVAGPQEDRRRGAPVQRRRQPGEFRDPPLRTRQVGRRRDASRARRRPRRLGSHRG